MESLSVSRPSHLDEVEGGEETNKSGLTPELDAPHIVHSNKTSAIYRHRKQGIKVIIDSDEGQISRLAHEHNISKYLSSSTCLYRKVLHVTEFQGKPAMYYQWTDGDTLQEWLDTITQQNIDFWNDRRVLQIAIAIAYSLSQLHDAGIAHNKLTPENIVLGTFEGCYVATLIDLSWATICPGKQSDPGEVATASIAKDLTDLGRVLNSIFTGNDVLIRAAETNRSEHGIVTEVKESEEYDVTEDEDSEEHNRQRLVQGNRSKQGKHLQPGEGLPLYLSSLISTLILTDTGRSNSELYPNVKNVLSDLRVLAKKSQLYMKRLNYRDNNSRSRLRIPNDVFYGRQAELSLLLHALNFVAKLGGEPTMTVVSGCAGAG